MSCSSNKPISSWSSGAPPLSYGETVCLDRTRSRRVLVTQLKSPAMNNVSRSIVMKLGESVRSKINDWREEKKVDLS